MNTAELLAELQARYPALEFDTAKASEVAGEDSDRLLITFTFEDTCMIDPTLSLCSRFPEDPARYGISEEDAARIVAHNAARPEPATPNHAPSIPLPWSDAFTCLTDPEYALHAANYYPRLVAAVKKTRNSDDTGWAENHRLLVELGEAE